MDDWRIKGCEDSLLNKTLYKISFPDFWGRAYAEKNRFYKMISEDAHRFVETENRGHECLDGEKIQEFWHAHCDLCWEKFTTSINGEAYCTYDFSSWVCPKCFKDFKDRFNWTVLSDKELT